MPKPNVLLIMADQFRGDCLGIDGHPDVKTPFLDTLALQGARFTRAYTATPSCIPARAGLMTGMCPAHHGRVGYQDGVPWNYENTLAGCFTQAGYQTKCVGKMHVHPLRNRLGFEDVELHDGYLHYYRRPDTPAYEYQLTADDYFYEMQGLGHKDVMDTGLDCNGSAARPWPYAEETHPTRWVGDRAVDFLRRRDREHPFFLTVSFVRPHPPFDAPEAFFDMYRGKDLRPPVIGDWAPETPSRMQGSQFGIADPDLLREAQTGYYACITQVDYQIGRIMEMLVQERLAPDTYVIFLADHGELLGDHNLFRKSLPYEGSARVPLLIAGPGIVPGTVSDMPVELMDVMPSLLDGCGISIPDTVDGKSFLPLARGEKAQWREWIHGEHAYAWERGGVQFIVTGHDKYIWFSCDGREQYFDLAADPREEKDRIADPACQARIAELRAILIRELNGREEGFSDGSRLIPGRPCVSVLHR
ncbi:MAG: arylsulfatase [Clostridia bacterium]|nr:arylsulfatase [Clostridia bacterium]